MIKLLVFDVDGCLTNGQIIYTDEGLELKAFNVKDGLAIKSAQKLGYKTAIITGRQSQIVARRAKELEVDFVFQGIKNKTAQLKTIMQQLAIGYENVAAIGDDMNDLKMLRSCAVSATPNDGSALVQRYVTKVLQAKGGEGAVREFIEDIFVQEDRLQDFIDMWL